MTRVADRGATHVDADMIRWPSGTRVSDGGAGRRRSGRTVAIVLLLLLILTATAEVFARSFWALRYKIPLHHPSKVLYTYYPELRTIDEHPPSRGDGWYDILLLGGSVLHSEWGVVPQMLREQMAAQGHHRVRLYSLAAASHTSRDAVLKYRALERGRFDLVVFYHGINEARVNNVPPDLFREDYSHVGWYELVNGMAGYHNQAVLALPYSLRFLAIRLEQVLWSGRHLPFYGVKDEWTSYGGTIRSARSFEKNVGAVLDRAADRSEPVLLMTFATHIPDTYSLEAFQGRRLDYAVHLTPTEVWGKAEHVAAAVSAHNDVIRREAADRQGVFFVDQDRLIGSSGRYFNDACHLTVPGTALFVENILTLLLPTMSAY